MSDDILKTRLFALEIDAFGHADPTLRLKHGKPGEYAKRARDVFEIPAHGGEWVGLGGLTISQWLRQERDNRPEDFESAPIPQGNPKTGGSGGAAELDDIDRAAARGGYSRQEFLLLLPGVRMSLLDEVKGGAPKGWADTAKAKPYGGLSVEAVSRLSAEEKIALGNESAHAQRGGQS